MAELPRKITDDPTGAAALIRRLVAEHGMRYRNRYAVALLLMGIAAAATAASVFLLGSVINEAYVARNFPGIVWLSSLAFALFAIKGAATYGFQVILSRISNAIIANNQRAMFSKLMSENLGFFADRHSSEFVTRLTTGAAAVSQVLSLVVGALGRDLLSLIGLIIVMVVQDPFMALFGLVIAPPAMIVLRKLVKRIRRLTHSQFSGTAAINETLLESLQGIRTIKAFTLEDAMRARIDASINSVQRDSDTMARVSNRSSPLMETLGGLAVCGALVYGGYRVVEAGAAPGEFFSFLTAFLLAYEPAKRLARLNIELNSVLIAARKLLEVIDSPATEPDDSSKPALAITEARVELRDVSFAYRSGELVLDRISFQAEPGKMTALVGPSGGGKSTILNLLLRLYEVTSGAIVIDGQEIAQTSRHSLRQQAAYVGQDVFLFRGTIRDNIAFGRPDATEADIVAAATAACAHDFISAFPRGYDTQVGEHGTQLSGGQRQRIAIARALIKDAHLILLDEATAALDSESELLVQEAIAHLCQGRTTIVIAHRLHTIMHADAIHVIEAGRVVETGKHDDLIQRGGRYSQFFRLQQRETNSPPLAASV